MKKQNKLTYETPTLTVVEFRTERGFATSGEGNFVINTHQKIDEAIENSLGQHMVIGQTDMGRGGIVAGGMTGNEDHSGDGGSSGWQYSNGGWF
jgi:hypothetical protein